MPVKSLLLSFTLALTLSVQASVLTPAAQLIEFISKKSTAETLLENRQIFNAGSEQIEKIAGDFELAIKSFGITVNARSNAKTIQRKLIEQLSAIKTTSDEDAEAVASLIATLKKPVKDLSDDDIVKTHDELIYVSSRYGRSGTSMIVCLDCTAATAITSKGFKYTLSELKDRTAATALKQLRDSSPAELSNTIKAEMSSAKYGDYSKVAGTQLLPEQELAFALFLKLGKEGNGQQKSYVQAVERVLGKDADGNVDFFSPEYTHSLHMFFQENHEASFVKNYTKFLNDIADLKESKQISAKKAYEEVLMSKGMRTNADGVQEADPVLMNKVNKILGRCHMFK